jgi:hypothetical protein
MIADKAGDVRWRGQAADEASFGGNRLVTGRRLAADYQGAINERTATIDRGGRAPAPSKQSVIARSG